MDKNEFLNKNWTESDFEQMTWHDCRIHAISFGTKENEIVFDIDFILEWQAPNQYRNYYAFLIAPATLAFSNVYEISMNLATPSITIDEVHRNNPVKPKNAEFIDKQVEYDWIIETTDGEIAFKSLGFTQWLRKEPVLSDNNFLDLCLRGGISF